MRHAAFSFLGGAISSRLAIAKLHAIGAARFTSVSVHQSISTFRLGSKNSSKEDEPAWHEKEANDGNGQTTKNGTHHPVAEAGQLKDEMKNGKYTNGNRQALEALAVVRLQRVAQSGVEAEHAGRQEEEVHGEKPDPGRLHNPICNFQHAEKLQVAIPAGAHPVRKGGETHVCNEFENVDSSKETESGYHHGVLGRRAGKLR